MRIVVFDSGIGGLSVLHDACRRLPSESYLYYADTRNVPYGVHSKEAVRSFVRESVDDVLASHDIKALVVACNTATSAAVDDLRLRYRFPVVGMEPAVKPALQHTAKIGKRVLVMATPLTLKEQKFQTLVSRFEADSQVDALGMPELVRFAEAELFSGPEVTRYLRSQLSGFDLNEYGALVLGCTHFLFFRDAIRAELPSSVRLFDGNEGTVNRLREVLNLTNTPVRGEEHPDIVYMSSLGTPKDEDKLQTCFRMYAGF